MVLIAGETHVIHDAVLDAGVHELVAANGALPLPVDCYPTPDDVPGMQRVHWASAGQALRATAAGAAAGDVYPLLLGAYGCGPNSMIEHLFGDLVEDWPHAVLESDGHGGKAGYVTRVQAFLHNVSVPATCGPSTRGDACRGAPAAWRTTPPAPACRRASRASTGASRTAWTPATTASTSATWAAASAATSRRRCAAPATTPPTSASPTPPPCAPPAPPAPARSACPTSSSGAASPASSTRRSPRLDGKKALFLSAGNGFQACRANVFPLTEQISLERLGLGDRVEVADFSLVTGNVRMMPVVWTALVAVDLLNMLRFYSFADEAEPGASDALFAEYSGRLETMLEQPRPDAGTAGNVAGAFRFCGQVEELLGEAARAYLALPRDTARSSDLRDIYLCGDLYLRVDEWGNDDLQRKLAGHGLRVIFEPYGAFFELLQLRQIQDGVALTKRPEKEATLATMRYVIGRLVKAVRAEHPWVFWNEVRDVDRESRRLVAPYPFGETIPAVGGALLTWRTQPIDGVVSVAPRGCGPALIAEAQLRREAGLPALFVYADGDPIDEARLAGFAWRLRSRPARRAST